MKRIKKKILIKGVKLRRNKKVCFWANFAMIRRLYNKDQEVIQQGSGGYTKRIRRSYNKDQKVISRIFFGIGATIRIGQEMLCLKDAGFFFIGDEWRLL